MVRPRVALIESSAWVEFLRATGSVPHMRVRELVRAERFAYCEPVRMEVLNGAKGAAHARKLVTMFARGFAVSTVSTDWEDAAVIYRVCRTNGETVRKPMDCLIAAIAIRKELPVLHADRDFDVIARHTPLEVVAL